MEKIINKTIKNIQICENCLDFLNENIEKYYINSQVLFVVDFLTYKRYNKEIEKIKKSSLNNIIVEVLYDKNKTSIKMNKIIDETFSLVVGIGEFFTLNFVKEYTIKNNINFALCNLFFLKSEIFVSKSERNYKNNAVFVLIEQKNVKKEDLFYYYLNIYKYNFILFDCNNEKMKNDYIKIISSINDENIQNKIIELGLFLEKYNINFLLKYNFDDFKNFIFLQIYLIGIYNSINVMNKNNLNKTLNIKPQDYNDYFNFDFKYNKLYLLTNKNMLLKSVEDVIILNKNLMKRLKIQFFNEFYKNVVKYEKISIIDFKKFVFGDTFLKNMKYFELFNKSYSIFA